MSSLLISQFPLPGTQFFKVMNNIGFSFLTSITILHPVVLENQCGACGQSRDSVMTGGL